MQRDSVGIASHSTLLGCCRGIVEVRLQALWPTRQGRRQVFNGALRQIGIYIETFDWYGN